MPRKPLPPEQVERARQRARAHYAANKEKAKANVAAWQSANPEKVKAYKQKHAAENADKCNASSRRYRQENPEKRRWTSASYYERNAERINANSAKWALMNRDRRVISAANRRARLASGKLSTGIVQRLLVAQKGKCACCKASLADTGHHLDHNMPLALDGSNTDDNAQLLCPTCNLQKGAKHPVDFMQQRGYLL